MSITNLFLSLPPDTFIIVRYDCNVHYFVHHTTIVTKVERTICLLMSQAIERFDAMMFQSMTLTFSVLTAKLTAALCQWNNLAMCSDNANLAYVSVQVQ